MGALAHTRPAWRHVLQFALRLARAACGANQHSLPDHWLPHASSC